MRTLVCMSVLLVACCAAAAADFMPPTAEERLEAIGSLEGLPDVLRRAFEPGPDFEPMPMPRRGEWLAEHEEPGQTFDEFIASKRKTPSETRHIIYLQPLGAFPEEDAPSLDLLRDFTAAFFAMEVRVLPPRELDTTTLTNRINRQSHKRQFLTKDLLDLLKKDLPEDAFCVLGITMEDLYHDPTWNFVFAYTTYRARVGVYSFVRFDRSFYGEKRRAGEDTLVLRRSCKALAWATGAFGLAHCIHFRCIQNGCNHLAERDSQPLHLCPVCLRKLHHSIEFDVVERYRNLQKFYEKAGLNDEAEWVAGRLKHIGASAGEP